MVAGLASAGADARAGRGAAHAGGRPPGRRARRRPRRDDLRVAQRDAGQRHQAVRGGRAQAARRRRSSRSRRGSDAPFARPTGAAIGRVRDLPDAGVALRRAPARGHPAAAGRAAGRGRLRARRRVGRRPRLLRAGRRRGRRAARRAGRAQHQRRCGVDPPRPAARRPSARTAPTSASPTTATPTAAWPSTPTAATVDGDQIMAVLAVAMQEAGELVDDTLVATVMSNLGLHLAMREPASRCAPPRSATGTSSRSCAPAGTRLGGEQSGHVVLPALRHHRRRAADRAAPDGADGRRPARASPTSPGS